MKTLAAGLLLCILSSPAHAFHCYPRPGIWNDERSVALSDSLPANLYVARCSGTIVDFEYPSCMHFDNIYDGCPCPAGVTAFAAVLRAENGISDEASGPETESSFTPGDAPGHRPLLSDAQKERLLERIKKEAEKRAGGNFSGPSAAPWAGAYRLADGTLKADVGGSMALETWDCRLVRGRQCFAGFTAGKETVGLAVGFSLRSAASIAAVEPGRLRWQLVPNVGFVIPYASAGAQAAPCVGLSLKIW